MPDIKETLNAKNSAETLKAQQDAAASAAEQAEAAKETKSILADQNKIHLDTEAAVEQGTGSLNELVNLVRELAGKVDKQSESMAQMSAAQQAANMAKGGGDNKPQETQFKTIGGLLKTIMKAKLKEVAANTKMGKLFTKMGKFFKKDKKATKTIDGKSAVKPDKGKPGAGPQLDSKLIASSMAASVAKNLNPIALVTAFFTKLLPILLVLGILLYGFITGFLDGDVADFIGVMIGIIIAAVLGYIAYMLIKELIVLGIKVVCEFLKVAIEAAADWATVPIIIAMVAVIGIAFLIAAAIIIVIIGLALVGIVLAVWLITKVITSMIEDMTEDIMEIMGEQFEKLGGMINAVIETFVTLVPYMAEMMTKMANDLKTGIQSALIKLVLTFALMTAVMDRLASEISRIFNGIAAAIIASALGKMVKQQEEQAAEITIKQLTAEFATNPMMWALLAEYLGEKISDVMTDLFDTLADFIGSVSETIADTFGTLHEVMALALGMYLQMYNEAFESIKNLFTLTAASIITVTTALLTILLGMPILGLLMGLVGSNSFKDAIAPLLNTTVMIKNLLDEIVAGSEAKKTGIIKTTAINNSEIDESEQINRAYNNSTSLVYPTDGNRMFAETDEIGYSKIDYNRNADNEITQAFLSEQLEMLNETLLTIAGKISKDSAKGWF